MRLWWLVNHGLMLGSTVHQYHPIPSLCSTHPCEEKYKTVNNPILTKGWSGSVYNISVTSFVIIQKVYQYELNFWYSGVVSGTPIYLCITFSVFVVTKTLCISAEITLDIYLKIDTLRNLLSCMWPEPKCKLFCQLFCILMMILSENQVFFVMIWSFKNCWQSQVLCKASRARNANICHLAYFASKIHVFWFILHIATPFVENLFWFDSYFNSWTVPFIAQK